LLADSYTKEDVKEVVEYFKDRCLQGAFLSRLGEARLRRMSEVADEGAWVYRSKSTLDIDRGYHSVNHEKIIRIGLLGVLSEVEEAISKIPIKDDESYRRVNFLKGFEIVLHAGIEYATRYAELARSMVSSSSGSRKAELQRIAEICEWVPANPARTFHEAVQASWFLHVLMHLESRAQESPGRMDQYLFPYFQHDIEKGTLTLEGAIEILECLRVKMSTLRLFSSVKYAEIISGEAQYHNVTLAGQNADGEDATNELSYLFLEAASRTKTPHPTLSIRCHRKLSRKFAIRALELVKEGLGFPAFFNDDSSIPWLLSMGIPMDVARNHCISGCVHHTISGQTSPFDALFISIPKCLELALHNGVEPGTGKQLGPKTGSFTEMAAFEDLVEALKQQVEFFSREGSQVIGEQRIVRSDMVPAMLSSCFIDDCIPRGRSCSGNGARYNIMIHVAVGMVDASDSLAAMKKCTFENGKIPREELLEALESNFEKHADVRKMLLSAPKYGNDDDYVDEIAVHLYGWWRRMVNQISGPYGIMNLPAPYSISVHGAAGKRTGALPSGRLDGQPFADGSVSPFPGMDLKGPTAIINSAGKIDQTPLFGTLLNIKFHPSALKDREDLGKLYSLIRTYFDYGGKHMQFNVVDSETLREAQEHPENYRSLIIRVAGYSALFTELSRKIQDEIIMRTEFSEL
jgi:formate C-acetyltransferase